MAPRGQCQRIAKHHKTFPRDFCQQSLLIFEMTIGSRYAHPRKARGITQGKALDTVFGDQQERGVDQGCAQISVVVGAFWPGLAWVRGFLCRWSGWQASVLVFYFNCM
jgi:hypothetical protein